MSPGEYISAYDILQARIDNSYLDDNPRPDCCDLCKRCFTPNCKTASRCSRDQCVTCPPCKDFEKVKE